MADHSGHSFAAYFKRATSPIAVLALLKRKEMYAYEISQALKKLGDGKMSVTLLYPILYRLDELGYAHVSHTEIVDGRARNYYTITPEGILYFDQIKQEFATLSKALMEVLDESKPLPEKTKRRKKAAE